MNIELYETAQPGEWWCGVCKRGHEYDTACPDSGQIVEGVKVTIDKWGHGFITRKIREKDA